MTQQKENSVDDVSPRNTALELCNKLQRRARVMRDRRLRRKREKKHEYRNSDNW